MNWVSCVRKSGVLRGLSFRFALNASSSVTAHRVGLHERHQDFAMDSVPIRVDHRDQIDSNAICGRASLPCAPVRDPDVRRNSSRIGRSARARVFGLDPKALRVSEARTIRVLHAGLRLRAETTDHAVHHHNRAKKANSSPAGPTAISLSSISSTGRNRNSGCGRFFFCGSSEEIHGPT